MKIIILLLLVYEVDGSVLGIFHPNRIKTFVLSEMNCKTNRQRFTKITLFFINAVKKYYFICLKTLNLFLCILAGDGITAIRKNEFNHFPTRV